jgi:outer membrane protein OmpA-like peptidoglycan-associated protein
MKHTINKSKAASLVLLASLSSASFANDLNVQSAAEGNESTYWGLGIGSVLGGIIAGPPGIAIGASLGGAFGWGQDQHEALEDTQEQLVENATLANESSSALDRQSEKLRAARAQIGELKRSHQGQLDALKELRIELERKTKTLEQSDLASVLAAYSQEVYFKKGQAKVPDYASERIDSLAAFLIRYPHLQVTLTGYTDQSGPAIFNQKLSQARAEGVKDALLTKGISSERILIQSEGEAMANIAEGDQGNAILDRRVAIVFSQPVDQELVSNKGEQVPEVAPIDGTCKCG